MSIALTEFDFLSVPVLSQLFNVPPSTIHRWIQAGELPAFKKGRVVRVSEKAFREFLIENTTL